MDEKFDIEELKKSAQIVLETESKLSKIDDYSVRYYISQHLSNSGTLDKHHLYVLYSLGLLENECMVKEEIKQAYILQRKFMKAVADRGLPALI